MKNRIYYVAYNYYGSLHSQGFSNTYYVFGFERKEDRDEFLRVASIYNSNVMSISKYDIGSYIDRPRPFHYEAWRLIEIEPMERVPEKINHEYNHTGRMFQVVVSGDEKMIKVNK